SSVLLVGEPGTGREAFARYLHEQSPRANEPFVTLIASSLRDADADLQIFGREGSNGEAPQAGLLESASGGTLFINEVEDLPASAQRALIGVLESGRFLRLGGSQPVEFNARIVSSAQPGVE